MKRNVKLRFGGSVSLLSGKWALRLIPVLGLLFSASTLRAAVNPGGVKFNSGVRYSQWAINSRTNDFYANTTKFGLATYKADGNVLKEMNDTKGKLDYVPGLVSKSIIEAADYYQNFDWSKPWFLSVKEYGDKYCNSVPKSGGSLDDLNAVKLYIGLYNNTNASSTDKKNYMNAISLAQTGLVAHNTKYSIQSGTLAGDKVVGGWFHKAAYNNQMWLDGAYMGSALLAQIVNFNGSGSSVFGSSTADWDMVVKQMNIVWNMCWNSTDKLLYHAFEANAGTGTTSSHAETWDGLSGTKPYVFHSASYWGRANAWYLMALVDVLEAMNNAGQSNTTNYATLKQHLADLAAGIAARQDATTGGWYQVMDKKADYSANKYNGKTVTAVSNYIETSATAIFSAAYFKAVRLGLLDSTTQYDYKTIAKNAFEGLVNNFVNTDNGDFQIWGSCRSAGLGGDSNDNNAGGKKFRDGSNAYYLLGYDVPMVKKDENITEGKVLGGFIMAATEYERAYQNQDSKQILFAKDLAPQYDFSTTAGSLDATAYGTGAEKATYQWYKDGNAVDKATSATYTPTENGKYYCIAKAGNNTIQTSTTTVTAKAATEGGDNNSGETTTTSGTATFKIDDLKLLDSAPSGNEKSELVDVDGIITIKTGKKISWDTKNNGLKIGKKDQSTFSIIANNNAKIKKVIITQTDNNRELNYNPAGSKSPNDKVFTYDYSKTKPSEITVSYNTGGNIYVTNIVVEYENEIVKTDLTASFSQSTIDATEGDASVDVPALTVKVKAGNKVFTDYTATYTTTDANVAKVENGKVVFGGKGTTTISVNVTPNDATLYNDCTAEFTVNVKEKTVPPVDPTETTNVYDFKTGVGTTKSGNTAIEVTTDNIVFGANYKPKEGKYITITPKDGGFKVGDVITIKGTSTKGNALMTLNSTLDSETSEQYQFNALGTTETTRQYILKADCPVLYLGRASGSTATITGLTVTRAAAAENKTRLVATFPSNSITVVNTTATVELPELTVKAGDIELTNKQYTVKKESDNPAVATISGDEITINGIGTATIFAIITPIDQKNYEGCTATYQVTVKEPTPLAISTMDVTINTIDAEVKQPIIKVYGDNDKLLTLGKDYTLTYIVEGSNVTVDDAGVFSVTGSAYNWRAGTSKVTVTATPTTALGDTYKEGTLTFEYNVVKGKITPVFHEAFNDATIRVKTDTKKDKTFSVPLIYDGEDVSEYFDYTYTINGRTPVEIDTNNKVSGDTLTFRPAANGTYTIKVTAKPNTGKVNDDADDYSQVYNEPVGISFTVNVGDFTRPTVTVNPSTMTMYTGTFESAADVTVMNGKDIIPDNEYKLAWRSFTPGIVKVDADGNIEAVSEGNGEIRVSVYGDNLETMTAKINVYVDDPALYRAKMNDNDGNAVKYGNQRVMWNQDKTMSVSLGGWMFPNNVTTSNHITDEGLKSSYAWDNEASLAKWKLTGFDHFVMSNSSKNARQENGSNARPESTTISSRDFKTYTSTIKDQMFNVPCSGSYLVFNPATNGAVNVHIFQNGVFDASGNERVYSPQRRVFIMDEAGNFVSSSAHIESTAGKPTGGLKTIDNYKWDLNPKGAGTAPTIETVRSHFKNMPETFDMTEDGFKNNVYESNLSQDIVPNDAATKDASRQGVTGWSVLADSPVTYSFRVKAGKTYYLYNFGSKIGFYGYSFDEDATTPKVDEVNYDEAATNTVKSTEDGHVAKASINRTFKAGVWSTCVLPFSLNMSQVDAIFGNTYRIGNESGTEILYFDRVDENGKVWFVRHAYNTIVANKPFLIKPTKDVNGINTADCAEYPYVIIEAPESGKPAAWCEGSGYSWVSGYNNNDMLVGNGDGFIATDGSFMTYTGSPAPLKGFRGYLKKDSGAPVKMLSVGVGSNVDSDNTTTLIDNLIIDDDANVSYGIGDGKVYNINGQVVGNGKSLNTLPSGVYIINGKKYIK